MNLLKISDRIFYESGHKFQNLCEDFFFWPGVSKPKYAFVSKRLLKLPNGKLTHLVYLKQTTSLTQKSYGNIAVKAFCYLLILPTIIFGVGLLINRLKHTYEIQKDLTPSLLKNGSLIEPDTKIPLVSKFQTASKQALSPSQEPLSFLGDLGTLQKDASSVKEGLNAEQENLLYNFWSSPGFEAEGDEMAFNGEQVNTGIIQGTQKTREWAAHVALAFPDAFLPENLRRLKELNPSLFLFLMVKFITHRLELRGAIEFQGKKIHFEGFHENFTLPQAFATLDEFLKKENTFSKIEKDRIKGYLKRVIFSDLLNETQFTTTLKTINDLPLQNPVILPDGHSWHITFLIFIGDISIVCNRGLGCGNTPGIHFYRRSKEDSVSQGELEKLVHRICVDEMEWHKGGVFGSMWGSNHLFYVHLQKQNSGSCGFASVQALIFALLMISKLDLSKSIEKESLELAWAKIEPIYKRWVDFDLEFLLKDFMIDIEAAKNNPLLKATLDPLINAFLSEDACAKESSTRKIIEQYKDKIREAFAP